MWGASAARLLALSLAFAAAGVGSGRIHDGQCIYFPKDMRRQYALLDDPRGAISTPAEVEALSTSAKERERVTKKFCRCQEGQNEDFSSADVRDRFMTELGPTPKLESRLLREKGKLGAGVCSGREGGMQFVSMAVQHEQLTKGRMHMADTIMLTRRTQRTFVLPRVGNSFIRADEQLPLCTYFDTVKLGQFVPWVSQDVLEEHLEDPCFSVVPLFILPNYDELKYSCNSSMEPFFAPMARTMEHPFTRFIYNWIMTREMICLKDNLAWSNKTQLGDRVASMLRNQEPLKSASLVLLVQLATPVYSSEPNMDSALRHISFAPHLKAAAAAVAQDLEDHGKVLFPYMAVQWRLEKLLRMPKVQRNELPQRLKECASGLVKEAKRLGLVIFLSTDVEEDGRPLSLSFRNLPLALKRAAAHEIREIHKELAPSTWMSKDPAFPLLDLGIQGILDEIMAIDAPLFMHPPRYCGGLLSAYTQAILTGRGNKPTIKWVEDTPNAVPNGGH